MASGQTSNYGLNQWAAEDKVIRTEFNVDNAKIDAALNAGMNAVKVLRETRPALLTGTYRGDGSSTNTHLAQIGGNPSFLMILSHNASQAHVLFLLGEAILSKSGGSTVGVAPQVFRTDSGVTLQSTHSSHAMNDEWSQYSYIALY